MATHEIGVRMDLRQQVIAFFGVEEVNKQIAAGARVVEIRPGGLISEKTGVKDETTRVTLAGFTVQVVLTDS